MENGKQVVSASYSSSSLANDLFGCKDSAQPTTPNGSFSSFFAPPFPVLGMRISVSEQMECGNKPYVGNLIGSKGGTEDASKTNEGAGYCTSNKEVNYIFQERSEPCPLSSSLYYGAQEDMYVCSSNAKNQGSYQNFKKDRGEDNKNGEDSHVASRGNWWEGSLYY